ncbi:hypothetical protein, partial [Salmonella sp. SAL4356]|uniref:hypothetical protein n=1 Tax=Salmonella sp. SAL4356 TaxID=3159877 RepID=UPI00397B9E3D
RRAGVVAGGFGARVCRAWVRLYTARMDTETAARRREELESDLADHAREAQAARIRPSAASVEMIGRTLSGMPADLSWRWRSGGGRQG